MTIPDSSELQTWQEPASLLRWTRSQNFQSVPCAHSSFGGVPAGSSSSTFAAPELLLLLFQSS